MAVRDEGKPPASTGLPWREALSYTPALLLLSGLLMYGYLSLCYQRFYGSLGVDPNDVGLSYAGTLARSSGFVFVYLLFVAYAIGAGPVAVRHVRTRWGMPHTWKITTIQWLSALFGFLIAASLSVTISEARDAARDVQAGLPVGPLQFAAENPFGGGRLLPVPILAVHADPATVEPAGKLGDSPAVERLRGRKLLYLGQSGGVVVLYDAAADRAVYVPASALILKVANCDAKPPPDPACVAART
jgi:hypothetical protein